ncbi:hypothetical protein ACSBR1_009699 [Camellia fascicularis]
MIGAQLCVRTVSGSGDLLDRANVSRQIPSSLGCFSSFSLRFSFQLGFWYGHCCRSKSIFVSCKSSRSFGHNSHGTGDPDHDYLEAFVLLSETIKHYRMRLQGFQEEIKWQSSAQLFPFSVQAKESTADVSSIGPAFLRRFQSPTIFLKISCDGDLLLPIIVGEFAVEKLIDSTSEDESWDCPNQFQLVRNLVEKLGYRAPIYVNKQIVFTDGIRIAYGMGRMPDAKSIYDVSLDRCWFCILQGTLF